MSSTAQNLGDLTRNRVSGWYQVVMWCEREKDSVICVKCSALEMTIKNSIKFHKGKTIQSVCLVAICWGKFLKLGSKGHTSDTTCKLQLAIVVYYQCLTSG